MRTGGFLLVIFCALATGESVVSAKLPIPVDPMEAELMQYLPRMRHYAAEEAGRECSVFRDLARAAANRVKESRQTLRTELEEVKARRLTLNGCAKGQGVTTAGDLADEALLAEVCPAEYESWLQPSYRARMFQEDIEKDRLSLRELSDQLRGRCRPITSDGSLF